MKTTAEEQTAKKYYKRLKQNGYHGLNGCFVCVIDNMPFIVRPDEIHGPGAFFQMKETLNNKLQAIRI